MANAAKAKGEEGASKVASCPRECQFRRMANNAQHADNPGVIILPPLLYLITLVLGLLLHWIAPRSITGWDGRSWLGGALLASGFAISIWGSRVMRRAGTNVNPHKPSTALVATGPFRFSRNPLYVAFNLAFAGLALLVNSMWLLVLLLPAMVTMHFGVIRREERYLEGKFVDAYRAYRIRVRRYL